MPYGQAHDELIVIMKTYDLILWSCKHTGKFPRNHRFVLGERIERNLYDLLETLLRAKYTRQRQPLLEQDNLLLEILRFQARKRIRPDKNVLIGHKEPISNPPYSLTTRLTES